MKEWYEECMDTLLKDDKNRDKLRVGAANDSGDAAWSFQRNHQSLCKYNNASCAV